MIHHATKFSYLPKKKNRESGGSSEPPTRFSTTAAAFRTSAHHLVPVELLAVLGAHITHFGAYRARPIVQRRTAKHEVGACLANLRAIQQ
jgi:hypothetical protein